jgi:hypothetical protein
VRVPAIDVLSEFLEADPVSVAEVSLGQFLDLDRWPQGEAQWVSDLPGATTTVRIAPGAGRVSIDVRSRDLSIALALSNVASVDTTSNHGIKELRLAFDARVELQPLRLRLRPDVSLDW